MAGGNLASGGRRSSCSGGDNDGATAAGARSRGSGVGTRRLGDAAAAAAVGGVRCALLAAEMDRDGQRRTGEWMMRRPRMCIGKT